MKIKKRQKVIANKLIDLEILISLVEDLWKEPKNLKMIQAILENLDEYYDRKVCKNKVIRNIVISIILVAMSFVLFVY